MIPKETWAAQVAKEFVQKIMLSSDKAWTQSLSAIRDTLMVPFVSEEGKRDYRFKSMEQIMMDSQLDHEQRV